MKQLGFVFIVLAFCLASLLVTWLITAEMESESERFLVGLLCGGIVTNIGIFVASFWYTLLSEKERSR